jgi:hypothetical protein
LVKLLNVVISDFSFEINKEVLEKIYFVINCIYFITSSLITSSLYFFCILSNLFYSSWRFLIILFSRFFHRAFIASFVSCFLIFLVQIINLHWCYNSLTKKSCVIRRSMDLYHSGHIFGISSRESLRWVA